MGKAVKLVNNQYLSTQYVVHKRGGWYYLNNLLDNIYPIGSIFITTNTTNPSTYFGGSWERIKGRFLLGADDSTYKIGKTGGEATVTLTVNQIPSHSHTLGFATQNSGSSYDMPIRARAYGSAASNYNTSAVGGSQAHNNMPPYLVVYIWKRIS